MQCKSSSTRSPCGSITPHPPAVVDVVTGKVIQQGRFARTAWSDYVNRIVYCRPPCGFFSYGIAFSDHSSRPLAALVVYRCSTNATRRRKGLDSCYHGMMTWLPHDQYLAFLESYEWLEVIRPRILKRDRYRCRACGSRNNLQIHHVCYDDPLGQERDVYLITLCENCHEAVTEYIEEHKGEADMYHLTWWWFWETKKLYTP